MTRRNLLAKPLKSCMTRRNLLAKPVWRKALGAAQKSKRLKLESDSDGLFYCPIENCDSNPYHSKRGCRKHVYTKHGWYFYFNDRPDISKVMPETVYQRACIVRPKRSNTATMDSFPKTCKIAIQFKMWLTSPGGGGKSVSQADQLCTKVLKYAKFCCDDVCDNWEIPDSVMDYCLGSVTLLSKFVEHLQIKWKMGYSGTIGYMNAISHMLDYRRTVNVSMENTGVFIATEIYIDRVRKCLTKKMHVEWNTVLSIEYLSSINCWATLEELQKVVPFHSDRYKQVIMNASDSSASISPHDLSFATSFIVAVLFLMVKATRPMTFQYLTVGMILSIPDGGIVDQTMFKTNYKYGFDSLIFNKNVVKLILGYIHHVRSRLNPTCDYLLISRTGNQLPRLSDIFGRIVFQVIGKYIHPTRYRQIVETESASRLNVEDQNALSEDQKHTSKVAKVHYKKMQSREVAEKGKECMNKLREEDHCQKTISDINQQIVGILETPIDFLNTTCSKLAHSKEEITPSETESKQAGSRKKKINFSKIEDKFLVAGIQKYGVRWTSILNDPSYSFHPSRKACTLLNRAKVQGLI